jgi:hypothetical protein
MPRAASRPARQGRLWAALTQTKASAKKSGAQEPDEPNLFCIVVKPRPGKRPGIIRFHLELKPSSAREFIDR